VLVRESEALPAYAQSFALPARQWHWAGLRVRQRLRRRPRRFELTLSTGGNYFFSRLITYAVPVAEGFSFIKSSSMRRGSPHLSEFSNDAMLNVTAQNSAPLTRAVLGVVHARPTGGRLGPRIAAVIQPSIGGVVAQPVCDIGRQLESRRVRNDE
jgi:hypothetical protein